MKNTNSLFVEYNNALQNKKIQEILNRFDISEDIFQLLLEDYRLVRKKYEISESTYYDLLESFCDLIEENLVKKGEIYNEKNKF